MLTATYGESVISTPMYERGEPSGPMLNGTTYMVRPRMEPRNSSSSLPRISAGSFQLLVGPASTCVGRADEGAVLDPGDVARVGVGPVGARPLARVELGEGAGVDQLLAQELVLLVGPVEPVDRVRLAELDDLVDPREQSGVPGGGLHERHVELLQEMKRSRARRRDDPAESAIEGKKGCRRAYRRPCTQPETGSSSPRRPATSGGVRPVRWGGPCRPRTRGARSRRGRRRRARS